VTQVCNGLRVSRDGVLFSVAMTEGLDLRDDDADLEIAPGTVIHVARGAIGRRLGPDRPPGAGDAHDDETGAG